MAVKTESEKTVDSFSCLCDPLEGSCDARHSAGGHGTRYNVQLLAFLRRMPCFEMRSEVSWSRNTPDGYLLISSHHAVHQHASSKRCLCTEVTVPRLSCSSLFAYLPGHLSSLAFLFTFAAYYTRQMPFTLQQRVQQHTKVLDLCCTMAQQEPGMTGVYLDQSYGTGLQNRST
jgi:hypothetical protein